MEACREAAPGVGDVSCAGEGIAAAVAEARRRVGPEGVVCVTGSLYAVAAARRADAAQAGLVLRTAPP